MSLSLGGRSVKNLGRSLFKRAVRDDILGLAAELAYRELLAILPFIVFLAAFSGFAASLLSIDDPTQKVIDSLGSTLASDATNVLEGQLREIVDDKSFSVLALAMIGAVWASTSAMGTIMKAFNRAYSVEETRPFWKKTAIAVGLSLLASIFVIVAFTILFAGQVFAGGIAGLIGIEGTVSGDILNLARIPVVAVMLVIGMAFLYSAAPNAKLPFTWITAGALFFVVGWVVATLGFATYVSYFGSYQSAYGSLGGVMVLLGWLYLTSAIMLLGVELNALLVDEVSDEQVRGPREAAEVSAKTAGEPAAAR